MRSDVIRVKKPAWVRIVNPDPFEILGRTYRYDDHFLIRPDGRFLVFGEAPDGRALAAYEAPHPPTEDADCPTGALLFQSRHDLELAAEGLLDAEDRHDPEIPGWPEWTHAPAAETIGRARVPRSREVLARFPPIETAEAFLAFYREEWRAVREEPPVAKRFIRPGGTLTIIASWCRRLKVVYRANARWRRGPQCESGAWFWVDEAEFLYMALASVRIAEEERREIAQVRSLLSRL